jgi:ankyrin repeat protein
VYCEVAHICGLIPARIRQALTELPETLHETYQRTLREINKVEWEFAHRMFQFVAVSSRPLRVEELADLLAFDFGAGPIPKFHQDWRLEDSVDAVLSTCSAFLAIVDGQYYSKVQFGYVSRKVVQFSHFSVKEFLTSARLAGASDIITRRFHISMIPAHTLAAQTCLGILLHLDKDVVTIDSLEKWPLAEYAAENWADHARLEDVSRNVEDGMKQLLDPSKSHLAICIWIHDPGIWFEDRKPDRPLPPGRIPLHYAALWGLLSMVEFLVTEHPQDVDSRGPFDNATPLHLAVQMGHAKVARFLLESDADVTAQNDNGSSPLHLALQSGQVEIADMLIEYGADVTGRNDNESTLLHMASEMGQVEVTSMLIKHGVDVTGQNKEGSTPLHLAVRCGQLEVVGMLIEHGADVTAQTKDGWSPLHLALQWEQVEVAGMLIEHGADVTAQSEDKSTPLHLAVRCGQLEVVGILIERGADVTAQNKDGWTPLHLALQWGQMEVAGMLIERGVNVTAQDEDGSIPLHLASKWGEVEIVGMLIERGADVTAKNKDGSTPLHLASTPSGCALRLPQRYAEIARILLEHGADMTVQDKDGRTPLDLASSDQRLEVVVHVLLQYGPDPGTQDKSN